MSTQKQQQEQQRKMLIAIDGSDHSLRALSFYASNMNNPNDYIVFIYAIEPPPMPRGTGTTLLANSEGYANLMKEAVNEGKSIGKYVRQRCQELDLKQSNKFIERVTSNPGQAIVDAAKEEQIDIIIMGNRGMSTLRRTFLGSVSDFVLHHAQKPVLIIPPEKSPSRKTSLQQEALRKFSRESNK